MNIQETNLMVPNQSLETLYEHTEPLSSFTSGNHSISTVHPMTSSFKNSLVQSAMKKKFYETRVLEDSNEIMSNHDNIASVISGRAKTSEKKKSQQRDGLGIGTGNAIDKENKNPNTDEKPKKRKIEKKKVGLPIQKVS